MWGIFVFFYRQKYMIFNHEVCTYIFSNLEFVYSDRLQKNYFTLLNQVGRLLAFFLNRKWNDFWVYKTRLNLGTQIRCTNEW